MIGGFPIVLFMFVAFAALAFTSAFFPKWDIRWGGKSGRFEDKVPMSSRGRCAFGLYALTLAMAVLVGMHWPDRRDLVQVLFLVVGLGGMVAVFPVAQADKRRRDKDRALNVDPPAPTAKPPAPDCPAGPAGAASIERPSGTARWRR
jgi:hypothetical protein